MLWWKQTFPIRDFLGVASQGDSSVLVIDIELFGLRPEKFSDLSEPPRLDLPHICCDGLVEHSMHHLNRLERQFICLDNAWASRPLDSYTSPHTTFGVSVATHHVYRPS